MKIAIFAALPQEYRYFLKITQDWQRYAQKPLLIYRRQTADHDWLLVETGMGGQQLETAVQLVPFRNSIDLMISTGFAGSVAKGLAVGQVILADKFAQWNPCSTILELQLQLEPQQRLLALCSQLGIERAQIVTSDRPMSKPYLAKLVGTSAAVIDMESTLLAQIAVRLGIPFLCLRSISDGLEDELGFELDAITDTQGHINQLKVLKTIITNPMVLTAFYAAWRNSRQAAISLAHALATLLDLPSADLVDLVSACRLSIVTTNQRPTCP